MIILFIFNDQFAYEYRISNRIVEMSVHTHLHTYHFNIKKKKISFLSKHYENKDEKKNLNWNSINNSIRVSFFFFSIFFTFIDDQEWWTERFLHCLHLLCRCQSLRSATIIIIIIVILLYKLEITIETKSEKKIQRSRIFQEKCHFNCIFFSLSKKNKLIFSKSEWKFVFHFRFRRIFVFTHPQLCRYIYRYKQLNFFIFFFTL